MLINDIMYMNCYLIKRWAGSLKHHK